MNKIAFTLFLALLLILVFGIFSDLSKAQFCANEDCSEKVCPYPSPTPSPTPSKGDSDEDDIDTSYAYIASK